MLWFDWLKVDFLPHVCKNKKIAGLKKVAFFTWPVGLGSMNTDQCTIIMVFNSIGKELFASITVSPLISIKGANNMIAIG